MKNTLLIFCVLLITLSNGFCETKLIPSATWTIASISMGKYRKNETFMINGDTLINSIMYKSVSRTDDSIFNPNNSNYFCALREENNLWFIIPDKDSLEHLLYDFNAKTGDTTTTYNKWYGDVDLNVFNVDSILLNNKYYKRLELGLYDPPSGEKSWIEYWIEGIGSTNGFYLPANHVFDVGNQLLCFHRNDSLIYLDSPDCSCGYISTDVDKFQTHLDITIMPNPASDRLTIKSMIDLNIEIYDNSGKIIDRYNHKIIDISNYKEGMYLIKLFDTDMNYIKTEKMIKQ